MYPVGAAVAWALAIAALMRFLARLVAYPGSVNFLRRAVEYLREAIGGQRPANQESPEKKALATPEAA